MPWALELAEPSSAGFVGRAGFTKVSCQAMTITSATASTAAAAMSHFCFLVRGGRLGFSPPSIRFP